MGFKCGIVGLPNVGKSTLFNAITKASVEAANYPFCTINPNVGIVAVPDKRADYLAALAKSQKIVPATMTFVDIAGLVAGAAKGEGLGNQFLANIRETQAILHVVRCFENADILHVAGRIDPIKDIEVIKTELILADLEVIEKIIAKVGKSAKSGDKKAVADHNLLTKVYAWLNEGNLVNTLKLEATELAILTPLQLLTQKPVLYVANVDENGFSNNPYLEAVTALAQQENAGLVVICAALEAEIAGLADTEKQEFLEAMGMTESGLDRVIHVGYQLLGLQTYFTVGVKEVHAWTIHIGSTAPQAARAIHSDFEKGFIRVEVMAYEDFIAFNGEQGTKEAGKWRLEGKQYIVKEGDILHFRFNV